MNLTSRFLDRCFAFDQFGPLSIRPAHGTCWARQNKPVRLPATYHRTHGIGYFHDCLERVVGVLPDGVQRRGDLPGAPGASSGACAG